MAVLDVVIADPARSDRRTIRPPWPGRAAARLGLPALVAVGYVALGWARRWTVDDAFINYRVVKQIEAGNGPVFNVGERVEATTSSLWLAVLTVGDVLAPLRIEWLSIVLGLGLGVVGMLTGMAGALRLGQLARPTVSGDVVAGDVGLPDDGGWRGVQAIARRLPEAVRSLVVPLGAVAYLGVAATWDWATGGLENGLALAWLGVTFWAVVCLAGAAPWGVALRVSRRRLLATAALAGLGVLVRPDFVPFCAGFLVPIAWVAWQRSGGRARSVLAVVAAAAALPAVVQVFRMGYYGQLFPNTFYAKEATSSWWAQGWEYLVNFVNPYLLFVPVGLVLGWLVLSWRSAGALSTRASWRLVVVPLEVAVVLHTLAVVRVGGDYMHGRLLHATWFALLLPVLAIRATELRLPRRALLAGALAGWALLSALALRPPAGHMVNRDLAREGEAVPDQLVIDSDQRGDVSGVVDGRTMTRYQFAGDELVVVEDALGFPVAHSLRPPSRPVAGYHLPDGSVIALRPELDGVVVGAASIGVMGYAAPLDTWVYDRHGLADLVVARVRLDRRGTPGHEKLLGGSWVAAQFVDPRVDVEPAAFAVPGTTLLLTGVDLPENVTTRELVEGRAAAERALTCAELADLLYNARAPLTPRRFFGNMVDAVRLHGFRHAVSPEEAATELC